MYDKIVKDIIKVKGGINLKFLVIVDMQNDFIDGSLGSDAAQAIVPKVVDKIKKYRQYNDLQVIFTHDTHHDDYLDTLEGKKLPVKHCIEDTPGWSLSDELPIDLHNDIHVYKPTFGWLGWSDILRAIPGDTIEVVGLCTDICVVSNVLILRASFPDVEIIVDSNCCAGTSESAHYAALEVMKSCQIDVIGDDV